MPVDPDYPVDREAFMVEDSRARHVVEADDPDDIVLRVVEVEPAEAPHDLPEGVAYVIYTSGSTGRPKGVVLGHHHVLALFASAAPLFGLGPSDALTLFHSSCFDVSVWELWGALLFGGTLVIVEYAHARAPAALAELLVSARVTILNQVPTVFGYLLRELEESPLPCPITLFAGEGDTETRVDDLHAWSEHTSAAFTARVLPGDHFFLHSARRPLLASIAADLATGPPPVARTAVPVLEPGEVHVWHAATDELALDDGALGGFLAPDEVALRPVQVPAGGLALCPSRVPAPPPLAAYGADPGAEPFATGPNGKLEPQAGATVRFNASSSGGLAVDVVARGTQLGVDVERLRSLADRVLLASSTMMATELAELAELARAGGDEAYGAAFLRLWTVKEAFMKTHGTGLSVEPLRVTATATAADRWRVTSPDAAACSAFAVDVGPGAVVSLAVPGAGPRVRTLALTSRRLS